ncbi:site-specific integrase [Serratia ureilytica]|uniref:site-specific integrase n=1 Tax=Serratia ureilytica TaxID=300181 RepID=UPI0034C61D72
MTRRLLSTHSMLFVDQWLKILADLGRAPATILAYRQALAHYLRYCKAQALRLESARFEDFSAYLRPQLPGMTHPVASATLQLRISAIRLWYDFLFYQGSCDSNPVPRTLQPAAGFSARGLVPRIVKLPRIPDDTGWFSRVTAKNPRLRLSHDFSCSPCCTALDGPLKHN